MKKIIAIMFALTVMATNLFAQNGESIYRKYSGKEGVDAVYISPAMFRLIGKLPLDSMGDGEDFDLAPLVKSFTGFYLIHMDKSNSAAKNLQADVERFMGSGRYELLMEAKDSQDSMQMYTISDGKFINSLVMIADDSDTTSFICIDGRIVMDDLENLLASSME